MHAGLAAERIDAKAGIVRERRQLRRPARMARLGKGVLDERVVRLVGFGDAERRLRHELERRRQDGLQLPQLAGIGGGEDDLHFSVYSTSQ